MVNVFFKDKKLRRSIQEMQFKYSSSHRLTDTRNRVGGGGNREWDEREVWG